jgi:FKBP-type peptidyl-prolyl cis-trans isomerase FklB
MISMAANESRNIVAQLPPAATMQSFPGTACFPGVLTASADKNTTKPNHQTGETNMRLALPLISGLWLALAACPPITAAETAKLETESDRISYSLGHQLAGDLKGQGVELDETVMLQGLRDGLSGNEPLLDAEEMQTLLQKIKQEIVAKEKEQRLARIETRRVKTEQTRKAAEVFLTTNTGKPGVKTLPSGLQYKVIKPGKGRKPALSDSVVVNYRGKTIDGNEFGSTFDSEPESLLVKDVIPGMQEALQLMPEGARWELYIPPDLAFRRRGPLEDQALIYEIELLRIGETTDPETKSEQP